jgi:hypothetical protein
MPADTMVMLDLLHEAGSEAVTLDELGVAGVRDPAQALLALELAGHHVQRVLSREHPGADVECVRLAPPEDLAPDLEPPTTELAATVARGSGSGREKLAGGSLLPAGLVALLLLSLLALLARRS